MRLEDFCRICWLHSNQTIGFIEERPSQCLYSCFGSTSMSVTDRFWPKIISFTEYKNHEVDHLKIWHHELMDCHDETPREGLGRWIFGSTYRKREDSRCAVDVRLCSVMSSGWYWCKHIVGFSVKDQTHRGDFLGSGVGESEPLKQSWRHLDYGECITSE